MDGKEPDGIDSKEDFTGNIYQRKKSDVLYKSICVHSVTHATIIDRNSSISTLNNVNHAGKHNFACG